MVIAGVCGDMGPTQASEKTLESEPSFDVPSRTSEARRDGRVASSPGLETSKLMV